MINTIYTEFMPAKGKTPLNINIDTALLEKIDKYRHRRMFSTRTEAIEFLLQFAVSKNPPREDGNSPEAGI